MADSNNLFNFLETDFFLQKAANWVSNLFEKKPKPEKLEKINEFISLTLEWLNQELKLPGVSYSLEDGVLKAQGLDELCSQFPVIDEEMYVSYDKRRNKLYERYKEVEIVDYYDSRFSSEYLRASAINRTNSVFTEITIKIPSKRIIKSKYPHLDLPNELNKAYYKYELTILFLVMFALYGTTLEESDFGNVFYIKNTYHEPCDLNVDGVHTSQYRIGIYLVLKKECLVTSRGAGVDREKLIINQLNQLTNTVSYLLSDFNFYYNVVDFISWEKAYFRDYLFFND